MLDPLRVGLDLHAVLGRARARGHQHARPLDLDDADAAGVDRREVVGVAERGRVDPVRRHASRSVDPSGTRTVGAVDLDVDQPPRRVERHRLAHACAPSTSKRWSRCTADCTADAAVWPSPQIEASRITCAISSISASSCCREPIVPAVDQPVQRLLLADGADAARDALAAGLVAEEPRDPQHDVDQVHRLVERHHDAGAERVPARARVLEREPDVEIVRRDEAARGAAEQDRLRRRPGSRPPDRARSRSVAPDSTS